MDKKRTTHKKTTTARTKSKAKKSNWSWGSIIAVLLALLFLGSMLFTRPKSRVTAPSSNSSTSETAANSSNTTRKAEPAFIKEGELVFRVNGKIAQQIDIEIVDQPKETQQGLMYRTKMAENQGMLFVFSKEEPRSFWMRNTFIPLDIIYVDANKKIVSIQKYTTPQSDKSLPSEGSAQFVLEVNAGFCDRYGIGKGDNLEF